MCHNPRQIRGINTEVVLAGRLYSHSQASSPFSSLSADSRRTFNARFLLLFGTIVLEDDGGVCLLLGSAVEDEALNKTC